MTKRIFLSIMLAAMGVLLASILIIMGCLYEYFGGLQEKQMIDELSLAETGVELGGQDYLKSLPEERFRLTWIAADGAVLYDDQADEQSMENHMQREEVKQALENGEGQSTRYSNTMLRKTIYYAKQLSDGTVLRISVSRATMGVLVLEMMQPILIVAVVALVLAFVLAKGISESVVRPLNRLDLDNPMENRTYEEIQPLLMRIHQQRRQIDLQLKMLRRKNDEFAQITESMSEGLVLINKSCEILSINPAAQALFNTDSGAIGRDLLLVERGGELSDAVMSALSSGHGEVRLERDGREYQIDVSRIESDGMVIGAVVLSFDISERMNGERIRREFTANVSHELKTPLTSILGAAELIENGMVKSEDMPRFVGHIHDEASRLLALIEDIIRLSQLDEGQELPEETLDMNVIVSEAINELEDTAQRKKVRVRSESEAPCPVKAPARLLHEIAYNLIENAIKYNVEGGTVDVCLERRGGKCMLIVSDTGIGIPPEHQGRVFERFYRVDKSHSKASGGTGLGLSIVKHAASYCGASIQLQSEPGGGTRISVSFPAVDA